jgi:two-component system response regulator HydG
MNAVERAVVLARTDYITRADLPFGQGDHGSVTEGGPGPENGPGLTDGPGRSGLENRPLSRIEKQAILSTLAAAGGNKSETARRLGITRKTLLNKLKQYGKDT